MSSMIEEKHLEESVFHFRGGDVVCRKASPFCCLAAEMRTRRMTGDVLYSNLTMVDSFMTALLRTTTISLHNQNIRSNPSLSSSLTAESENNLMRR
mmetsp:Transcript_22678/g.37366  ORF Transcript_22678/g.37366 Transcript_22678/m.37366 type:complete len:96 (-) Transcript_22678:1856-2143(-)